jgi:hypothetical protein
MKAPLGQRIEVWASADGARLASLAADGMRGTDLALTAFDTELMRQFDEILEASH